MRYYRAMITRRPAQSTCAMLALVLSLAGCGAEGGRKLPGVYRPDIQQGNIIEQDMLDRLKPGMDKNQVKFIMGTPAVADPFHSNRWDYVYSYSKGGARREQRHLTLYFEDDKLAYIDGDVVAGLRPPPDEVKSRNARTLDVPLKKRRQGLFGRLVDSLPFVGDDEPATAKAAREASKPAEKPAQQTEQEPAADAEDDAGSASPTP